MAGHAGPAMADLELAGEIRGKGRSVQSGQEREEKELVRRSLEGVRRRRDRDVYIETAFEKIKRAA